MNKKNIIIIVLIALLEISIIFNVVLYVQKENAVADFQYNLIDAYINK